MYTMLAQSLSLVAGISGQISLAHAGFFGIGAYTSALLTTNYHLPFFISTLAAVSFCGIFAYTVSKLANRTVDDYYIIITLGIQVVVYSILNNWQEVTRGPLGIPGIPDIKLFGIELSSKWMYLVLTGILATVIWFILYNIFKSPFGRVLRALSHDEIFATSLGKNVGQYKAISFTISGMIAAIPGVLYAHYIGYIDPSGFTIDESIFILSIVIIGGMRNLPGIFMAAAFLVLLPELLRFFGMPSNIAANVRQIIYGLALVIIMFRYRKKKTPNTLLRVI